MHTIRRPARTRRAAATVLLAALLACCAHVAGPSHGGAAKPVEVPATLEATLVATRGMRALDNYEDAVALLHAAEAKFGPSAALRLDTAWNLLMMAEEDMTRDVPQFQIDAGVADARSRYTEAVRMDPDVESRELLDAKILRYEGKTPQARRRLEEYLAKEPGDAEAHQELGDIAVKAKDWAVAEREYSAVAALLPDDGWAVLYTTIARQWLGRPVADVEAGYLRAAHMLPDAPAPTRLLVKLHAAAPDRAVAALTKIVEDQSRNVWARIWIAHVLRTRTNPDVARAESVLREAVAVDPKHQAARFNLGELLESQGRVADAVSEYAASADAGAEDNVGDAADALDRVLRADAKLPADLRRRAWDAVVAKNPTNGRFAHDAGRWYADVAHDAETARRYLAAAAKAEPENEEYRTDVARAATK